LAILCEFRFDFFLCFHSGCFPLMCSDTIVVYLYVYCEKWEENGQNNLIYYIYFLKNCL
jgi:hypothetical protein